MAAKNITRAASNAKARKPVIASKSTRNVLTNKGGKAIPTRGGNFNKVVGVRRSK